MGELPTIVINTEDILKNKTVSIEITGDASLLEAEYLNFLLFMKNNEYLIKEEVIIQMFLLGYVKGYEDSIKGIKEDYENLEVNKDSKKITKFVKVKK
jgi:hypothetical protein